MGENYKFFNHKDCEFFPCHKTNKPEEFNCLFCYCPLYALGENCGGNFKYTDKGIKDCSNCMLPHKKDNYNYIMGKFQDLVKITSKK
ncbi:cysteine-rich small domain-containing protein [Clostridioides difficile]|uniref:cysteine-rich small domain-containing protein n=1 Tax=Clostridioides difficile TaxID=1496 RepID=UPI0002F82F7E|nr:cysteine-rich small domain-containing protein [Clostridioides difficile]EKJ1399039.1 cysteine-rich small domain-containing protein [Clostridioides difficile]MCR1462923.1 cysteine-rich small domain-containing protein [Clostridioides difficile]MDI3115663.1 cysteine-rich small domain-containing protein [Clostridioides difficile]MDL5066647.1 cysteine-rich small domain-containing protein [Clostridioides difficile]MDN9453801.1 cysteine-rich small domain-containing protein [Clostridioides difficil